MVTTSAIEVIPNLVDISGPVKSAFSWVRRRCGLAPLATLDRTERAKPAPGWSQIVFLTSRCRRPAICSYAPDLTAELLPTAAVVPYVGGAVPLNTVLDVLDTAAHRRQRKRT